MRDDPYPARYDGRQIDEPFASTVTLSLSSHHADALTVSLRHPFHRVILIFMMLYLLCALFLIFTVSSYAAPQESATIFHAAISSGTTCLDVAGLEVAALAAH